MEKIIDNLEEDEFKGKDLFTYSFSFKKMNEAQKEYVTNLFHDWDWEEGLHIAELIIDTTPNDTKFVFKSGKSFEDKDWDQWDENDLENNILTKLIGKGQFISQFQFSECQVEEIEISFFDNKGIEYNVEVSKDSSLEKK